MRLLLFILHFGSVWANVASLAPSALSAIKHLAIVAPTGYAPQKTTCPGHALVRKASGISFQEQEYISQRKPIVDAALSSWLGRVSHEFDSTGDLPVLAFSTSGGGERAQLIGTGNHAAFDERTSNASVAGLWQSLTYESALSGGGIFLTAWALHNWEPIPKMISSLWQTSLNNGLVYPRSGGTTHDSATKDIIYGEIYQKALAGYPVSFVDLLGRYEAYSFLRPHGAPEMQFRDIANQPMFQSFNSPYPMIISSGVNEYGDNCPASKLSDPQYEYNPFEFGSWDHGVSAFVNLTYLGSQPYYDNSTCVTDYDNAGFVISTSGDAFGLSCPEIAATLPKFYASYGVPDGLVDLAPASNRSTYAQYPNPFYKYPLSPAVSEYPTLEMIDGGLLSTAVAIWPLLFRDVDVIFVSDSGADTIDNYTNGTDMYRTYLRAQRYGLTHMPPVPDPKTFLQHGLGNRNIFYGCNSSDYITIVYMPNRDIVYQSNYTATPEPMSDRTLCGLLDDGRAIANNGGEEDWAECVGCAILNKSNAALPSFCEACFAKYCAVWD